MKSLDEIGIEAATDKSSLNHHYLDLYELIFDKFKKQQEVWIMEVGIQFGNSLLTWRNYFGQNAFIVGIDSVDNNVTWMQHDFRLTCYFGDAYTAQMMKELTDEPLRAKNFFHIIIDDGSHDLAHQKFFVREYSKLLTDDGILIVEDVLDPDAIHLLAHELPPEFRYFAVDMTEGNSQVDSRLFIARRKF